MEIWWLHRAKAMAIRAITRRLDLEEHEGLGLTRTVPLRVGTAGLRSWTRSRQLSGRCWRSSRTCRPW